MSADNESSFIELIKSIYTADQEFDSKQTIRLEKLEEVILRNAKRGEIGTVVDMFDFALAHEVRNVVVKILAQNKCDDTLIEANLRLMVMNSIHSQAVRLSKLRGGNHAN